MVHDTNTTSQDKTYTKKEVKKLIHPGSLKNSLSQMPIFTENLLTIIKKQKKCWNHSRSYFEGTVFLKEWPIYNIKRSNPVSHKTENVLQKYTILRQRFSPPS